MYILRVDIGINGAVNAHRLVFSYRLLRKYYLRGYRFRALYKRRYLYCAARGIFYALHPVWIRKYRRKVRRERLRRPACGSRYL